jgi:hypothetical protein
MENPASPENKKRTQRDYAILLSGSLIFIISCAFLVGSIALDVAGEKTIGKLSNASVGDCPPGKSCWTTQVDFTTKDGEQVTFYPMTFPMLIDFDPFLSGRPYEEYGNYQVRYFAQFPQIAKVKLAFFLEYINMICGIGVGLFMLLISQAVSYIFSSNRKPIVIDLSKRKGK